MRIVIPILALTPHGGVRVLIEIANYLCEKHNVKIITSTYNSSPYILNDKVKVVTILNSVRNEKIKYILFLSILPFYLRCDLIIANHFLTVIPTKIASIMFRCKSVFFVQGFEAECIDVSKTLSVVLNYINKISFKLMPVISANKYLSNRLKKITDISFDFNLGVNKKWLKKDENILECKKYDVVYFIRDEVNKGIDRFIDIVGLNKNKKFLCITQNLTLSDKFNKNKNVYFCKPESDDSLFSHLDCGKIILLTSYKEGFALPPLEGMFRGLPLVYFNCGGPSVYTNNFNSIEIENCSDFSNAFSNIISNYSDFSYNSKKTANKFIIDDSLSNLEEYLLSLFKDK